jgi:hypothetical protein
MVTGGVRVAVVTGGVQCRHAADQRGRAAQQRRDGDGLAGGGFGGQGDGLQARSQDALHRAVAGVAGGQGALAGRVQPAGVVALGQAQHALGGAQVVLGVTGRAGEQLGDELADVGAGVLGALAAPGGRLLQERDLLGWVVAPVGVASAALGAPVGLDQLPLDEHLDQVGGGAYGHVAADQPPRDRIQRPVHADVAVGRDLRGGPDRQLVGLGGQPKQRGLLGGLEDHKRLRAAQRSARPAPGDLQRPGHRGLLHRLQAGEVAAGEEAVTHIRDRAFHSGLVLWLSGPCRVDQQAVVAGQLGIGAIQLGVVQVGADHAGLEVVGHQPAGRPAEEAQRQHVRLDPRG